MSTDAEKLLIPRTLPGILQQTIVFYREQFRTYAMIATMVVIPLTTISVLVDRLPLGGSDAAMQYSLILSLYTLVSVIAQSVFVGGPVTFITSEQYLGRQVQMGDAFRAVAPRLTTLGLGLLVFYGILMALGFVSVLTLLCFIGLLGLGVMLYLSVVINAFLAPVIVLENATATQGLLRAWNLAKPRLWPILGLLVIVGAISLGLSLFLGSIFSSAGLFNTLSGAFVVLLVQIVIATLTAPVMPIAMTLMYYDTRIRFENMGELLSQSSKPTPRPEDVPARPAVFAVDRVDFRNVMMITVGLVVLSLLLGSYFEALLLP